uniref:Uncharacterized protein n=1 Tax=Timema genevievae TaxID=629358 RepID=A0A7R9JWI5_TIMGE|nr:unnamed protein product [Timema genevievae]
MASCYPGFDLAPPAPPTRNAPAPHKDYTRPLHVDCSVEYELPNQAKPPEGARSEPLLMIHPCYYRRAESQRRSPFINNLPTRTQSMMDASLVAAPAPVPVYSKPSVAAVKHMKRDPMLCRGGDFSSGSDSGVSVSAGHWTDSDRSPLAPELRLQRDFTATTDSGIGTPVDDKAVLSAVLVQLFPYNSWRVCARALGFQAPEMFRLDIKSTVRLSELAVFLYGIVRTGGVDQRNRRLMSTLSYTGFNSYGIPNRVELIRCLKPDNLELIQFLKLAKTNTVSRIGRAMSQTEYN